MQSHTRLAVRVTTDLNRAPRGGAHAAAQGLEYRLLRGEARRESFGLGVGVGAFGVGEESLRETRVTLERQREAGHVHDVHAHAHGRHYSTVTVLARLRGRSTLRPRLRAMAYAKIWSGTMSTMGVNICSVAGTRNT